MGLLLILVWNLYVGTYFEVRARKLGFILLQHQLLIKKITQHFHPFISDGPPGLFVENFSLLYDFKVYACSEELLRNFVGQFTIKLPQHTIKVIKLDILL